MKKDITLEELEKKANDYGNQKRAKMKARYHLARELGFSVDESCFLQGKSESLIKRLADERNTMAK